MLSIGTRKTQFMFSQRPGGSSGCRRRQRFAQTILSSQQMDVGYMLGHKLGDRYVRIDEVQSREHDEAAA